MFYIFYSISQVHFYPTVRPIFGRKCLFRPKYRNTKTEKCFRNLLAIMTAAAATVNHYDRGRTIPRRQAKANMYCSTVCNVIVTSARGVANPERKDNEIPYRCGRKGIHGRNCRTFASRSVCDCTLVLKANVDKGSNRNRSSSRGKYSIGLWHRFWLSRLPHT